MMVPMWRANIIACWNWVFCPSKRGQLRNYPFKLFKYFNKMDDSSYDPTLGPWSHYVLFHKLWFKLWSHIGDHMGIGSKIWNENNHQLLFCPVTSFMIFLRGGDDYMANFSLGWNKYHLIWRAAEPLERYAFRSGALFCNWIQMQLQQYWKSRRT